MRSFTTTLLGVGLVALQGCSSSAVMEEEIGESQAALTCTDTARSSETCANAKAWGFCGQSWFAGYCQITCGQCTPTTTTPTPTTTTPTTTTNVSYATCQQNGGVNPTMAALAVAMATELGRWKPNTDLVKTGTNQLALSSAGLARCTDGCKNTKALLGQAAASRLWFDGLFDPTNYGSHLVNGLGRQAQHYQNLTWNYKSQVPPEHKLTKVFGPTDMGVGACGPHYVFQVDNLDGSPMTAAKAANMANWLCFYGMTGTNGYGCGGNPNLWFLQTGNGCPAGRTCIAIDPTDGDNGTLSSTSAGSAPTYPFNRVYDPANTLLGTACITTKGVQGTMVSKCSVSTATCGFLYCIPPTY